MGKKKHKKKFKDDKYEQLELFNFGREWKKIFDNWDGETHKKYKGYPEQFKDDESGKIVINKKKKSMRPYDVFLLEKFPDRFCCKKTETKEEKIKRREKILEKQSEKLEMLEMKNDIDFWKAVDRAKKHPNKNKNKMSKNEKKILDFFNKRNGIDKKKLKKKNKKYEEKYNKLGVVEFLDMVEIDKLELLIENSKKGWVYGYNKKGKKVNPHKSLLDRQMKRYNNSSDKSRQAIDVFKETLVEEIEARLMYDPFSINGHPVIDYSKYDANISKSLSKKDKKKKHKENKLDTGRLII